MKTIPIQIIQQKIKNQVVRFSIIEGIKTLAGNIKMLFTQKILGGGNGWQKISIDIERIEDYSLLRINGKLKFVKTPNYIGDYDIGLKIIQTVKNINMKEEIEQRQNCKKCNKWLQVNKDGFCKRCRKFPQLKNN